MHISAHTEGAGVGCGICNEVVGLRAGGRPHCQSPCVIGGWSTVTKIHLKCKQQATVWSTELTPMRTAPAAIHRVINK